MSRTKVNRIEINSRQARALLKGSEVSTHISQKAQDIANTANSMDGTPDSSRGDIYGYEPGMAKNPRKRAVGSVTAVGPTARRRNASNNTLIKALEQNRQ